MICAALCRLSELGAFYACVDGLPRDELCYILDPAEVEGAECPSEAFRALKQNDICRHCEFRTARLLLAWDPMDADDIFSALGL